MKPVGDGGLLNLFGESSMGISWRVLMILKACSVSAEKLSLPNRR